jgi:hypothetical protein
MRSLAYPASPCRHFGINFSVLSMDALLVGDHPRSKGWNAMITVAHRTEPLTDSEFVIDAYDGIEAHITNPKLVHQ